MPAPSCWKPCVTSLLKLISDGSNFFCPPHPQMGNSDGWPVLWKLQRSVWPCMSSDRCEPLASDLGDLWLLHTYCSPYLFWLKDYCSCLSMFFDLHAKISHHHIIVPTSLFKKSSKHTITQYKFPKSTEATLELRRGLDVEWTSVAQSFSISSAGYLLIYSTCGLCAILPAEPHRVVLLSTPFMRED